MVGGPGFEPGASRSRTVSEALVYVNTVPGNHIPAAAWRSKPGRQRVAQSGISALADPGDVSVRPDQDGRRRSHLADHRKLPDTGVRGVNELNAVGPRCDIEPTRLAEVEQDGPGGVEQLEDPKRGITGHQVQVGHATSQQRMSLAQVVRN